MHYNPICCIWKWSCRQSDSALCGSVVKKWLSAWHMRGAGRNWANSPEAGRRIGVCVMLRGESVFRRKGKGWYCMKEDSICISLLNRTGLRPPDYWRHNKQHPGCVLSQSLAHNRKGMQAVSLYGCATNYILSWRCCPVVYEIPENFFCRELFQRSVCDSALCRKTMPWFHISLQDRNKA